METKHTAQYGINSCRSKTSKHDPCPVTEKSDLNGITNGMGNHIGLLEGSSCEKEEWNQCGDVPSFIACGYSCLGLQMKTSHLSG